MGHKELMNKRSLCSLSGAIIIFLIAFQAIFQGSDALELHQHVKKHRDYSVAALPDYGHAALVLSDSETTGSSNQLNSGFDSSFLHEEDGFVLLDLHRKVAAQLAVFSQITHHFGIREIIFPTHYFW